MFDRELFDLFHDQIDLSIFQSQKRAIRLKKTYFWIFLTVFPTFMPQDWIAPVDLHSSIFKIDVKWPVLSRIGHLIIDFSIKLMVFCDRKLDSILKIAPIDLWKRSTVIKPIPPIFKKLDREWIDPVDLLKRSMGAIHRQSDHSTACLVYTYRLLSHSGYEVEYVH